MPGCSGKIIGVYLGRNFEGWPHERVMAELGEVNYYTNEHFGQPLVVTDDDISGTFTFLRALADNGNNRDLTAAQIGDSWLNYLIEERAILWWGGLGMSTEHTAFLRLKAGIQAPESGSIGLNSQVIAEQIGAQIFIDGWAMVAPGDPELAADLARRAASVSHDGEAIYGAQVIAAMESLAFVEPDLDRLLDTGLSFIPIDSTIARLIGDLREWRGRSADWRETFRRVEQRYGYDRYLGSCHIVPNHAIVILALLHGDDDFQRTLMIANTCGWDTDCNSGNVGCLMGIKNGLAGIDKGPDWRGPVADRMYVSSADGGESITDAVREAAKVINIARALTGEPEVEPGPRFNFGFPGAVQGFRSDGAPDARGVATLENVEHGDGRSLAIDFRGVAPGRVARVITPTFIPPSDLAMERYSLLACPTLYPGQTIRASVSASGTNAQPVDCRLIVRVYDELNGLTALHSGRRRWSRERPVRSRGGFPTRPASR
ncbi:MAG: ADP-ribosylglycohydrolase family protein [Thermomicrobiales bacterium]